MRRNDDRAFCCHIQRVAIRVRTDDGVRSYPATGAGAVFHHDWLAKRLLQLRSKQSREKVRTAACRKAGDNKYRLAGEVGLCLTVSDESCAEIGRAHVCTPVTNEP